MELKEYLNTNSNRHHLSPREVKGIAALFSQKCKITKTKDKI
tara:strand:- start:4198 stop:4323 length:126 start_codon:yes stop_codon:yes gene_type:complete